MDLELDGRVALVTGSSQGIGQGVAIRLAQEGAKIVVNYHSHPEGADDTVKQIQDAGSDAIAIQADLGKHAEIDSMMQQGLAKLTLTVMEVVRQVLERQAMRRVESGTLSEVEVERMGVAFMQLSQEMGKLSKSLGLGSKGLDVALGSLLVASLATQFMFNGGTVVVQLLASPAEQRAAGTFLNGRVLAFVPLFLFQAVTAALLPRLSALHSRGSRADFQRTVRRLLLFVGGLGAVAIAGAFVLGPAVLRLVFGPAFLLSSRDLALLAASCTALMAAQALGQGLIARTDYRGVVAGWLGGVAAFFVVVVLVRPLLLRVELGLVVGGLAAAAVLAALQPTLWRGATTAATV